MYKITLSDNSYYANIKSFKIWDLDSNYFIFYWDDEIHLIIKKADVFTIKIVK